MTYSVMVSENVNQITDTIYLGNSKAANNVEYLKKLGIKKVLSLMCGGEPKYPAKSFIHKKLFILDRENFNLLKYFGECLPFIEGDEKVLVHCAVGMSRSATIVIAYIMWKNQMSFYEAFDLVKSKRGIVEPNSGFVCQLKHFEYLLKKANYDIDEINFGDVSWNGYYCQCPFM